MENQNRTVEYQSAVQEPKLFKKSIEFDMKKFRLVWLMWPFKTPLFTPRPDLSLRQRLVVLWGWDIWFGSVPFCKTLVAVNILLLWGLYEFVN